MITRDVAELASRAFADVSAQKTNSINIEHSVLSEVCFVLEFHESYELSRKQIVAGLLAFFDSEFFKDDRVSRLALDIYSKNKKLDFVDCLLLVKSGAKRSKLLTFDKDLAKELS